MRPVRFLFDENAHRLIGGALRRRYPGTEMFRVGKSGAPALGTGDPELLLWCEEQHAILLSFDRKTLPGHVADHYSAGHRTWGVFILRTGAAQSRVLDDLRAVIGASDAEDWQDTVFFIPFEPTTRS